MSVGLMILIIAFPASAIALCILLGAAIAESERPILYGCLGLPAFFTAAAAIFAFLYSILA